MTKRIYVPEAGHIIQFHFDTSPDSAQPDRRPALVLSPAVYNKRTGLVITCAITTQPRGYPFEVNIPGTGTAILADQIKSLNWTNARISHTGRVDAKVLTEVRAKLNALLAMV